MAITVQNKKVSIWAWILALAASAAIVWLVFIFVNQGTPEQKMPPNALKLPDKEQMLFNYYDMLVTVTKKKQDC